MKLHTSLRPCYKRPPKINSRKDGRVEEVAAYGRFHPDISSRIWQKNENRYNGQVVAEQGLTVLYGSQPQLPS